MAAGSLQGYGGAIAATSDDESAFSHRHAFVEFVASAGWTDPAEDDEQMDAARRFGAALEPFASGVYVNTLSDEGESGVRRAYPAAKLARLAGQAAVRPRQRLPPQPEHPARAVTRDSNGALMARATAG